MRQKRDTGNCAAFLKGHQPYALRIAADDRDLIHGRTHRNAVTADQEDVFAFFRHPESGKSAGLIARFHLEDALAAASLTGILILRRALAEAFFRNRQQHAAGILESYDFVEEKKQSFFELVLPLLIVGLVLLILWFVLMSKANSQQAMANFGAKAEPVLTTVKKGFVDILNAFMDMFKGADLDGLKSKIEGAFKWFIDECVPAIKKGINFVVDNKDVILALIAGIGAGFAAWKVVTIIQGIVKATKAWLVATEGLTVAQRLLNLVQMANPIGLVIAAIAALVAIFIVLWKKCDWFREFWINLWEKIKDVAGKVWEAIKKFFVEAWDAIKDAWASAVEWFKAIWDGIKKVFMGVVTFYATVYGTAWKMIKKAWSGVVNWFKNVWEGIKKIFSIVSSWFKQQFANAWNGIKNAWATVKTWFSNIWNGIKAVFSAVGTWFKQQFTTAWNNIKLAWSTVKTWFSNIWNGIKNVFASVASWFLGKFQTAWNNIKNAWAGVVSFFSNIWTRIKNVFSSVGSTIGGFFKNAWSNVKSAWSGVTNFFSGIVTKIKKAFSGIKDKFLSIGKDMMNGIKEGVKSKVESVKKAVKNGVEKAVDGVKSFLGINSPSKLMRDEIGKMMGEGVGVGILASTKGVLKDAQKFTDKISGGLSSRISDINVGLGASANGLYRGAPVSGVTNVTNNYNQVINSPKSLDRKTIYRNSKNLLSQKGGVNSVHS